MSSGLVVFFLVLSGVLGVTSSEARPNLPHGGKIWALLVAGSNGYSNYRHQADICHAYQILHDNDIPDENIIVMMYDDIAHDSSNPTPGVLINEPGGSDVYAGVPKDYTGKAVNSSTFLAVLRGDKAAVHGVGSGRVIESGPHDHIFVNFVDHGAPGLLVMPSDVVYASQLLQTLLTMSSQNRFSKMVLFVEACESGSMFDGLLPDDTNIFAITAADPKESSYACYYDSARNTYLGDLFSVLWMQETEEEEGDRQSLNHQFEVVRTRTNMSHVEAYGDLDLGALPLTQFIGPARGRRANMATSRRNNFLRQHPTEDIVNSRDVPIAILEKSIENEHDKIRRKALKMKLFRAKKLRGELERRFMAVVRLVAGTEEGYRLSKIKSRITNRDCYETVVKAFSASCANIVESPHALSQLYLLANLCEAGYSTERIRRAIYTQCTQQDSLYSGVI